LSQLINSSRQKDLKFRAHYTLVDIYALNQNWQAGLHHLARLISLSPQINNKEIVHGSQINIAMFYNQIGQYQQAINHLEKVNSANDRDWCIVHQQFLLAKLRLALEKNASISQQKQLTKQLTKDLPKGLKSCELTNETLLANLIRTYQAELYLNNQQADRVLATLQPYNEAILATNYPILITLNYNLLAQAYWLKKDIVNTEKYAQLAHKNSQLLAQTKQTVITYQLLFKLAEQAQDYPNALKYHKKYSEANQTVLDETQAKHFAYQLARYNNFADKKEIEQLNQQNKLLNTQHALSEQQQENSFLLILLLLSFLAVFFFWSYKSWVTQQRLKLLTQFDSLTQAHTRGHFILLAQESLKDCKKNKLSLTCVLFDIDFFKKINDQYGQSTGDKVLIKISEVCLSIGRQNEIFGRLGGEEFAFILPGCSMEIAEDIANRCREEIAQIDHQALGIKHPITASFGVSDVLVSGFELDNLLADADNAMYASKAHGRNCVNSYR
jgi:diguanylate cyclase (GGDEF)-like protein